MKTLKMLSLTSLLALALAMPALAAPPAHKGTYDAPAVEETARPRLTPEQHAKYVALFKDYEAKTAPLQDKLWGKFLELRAAESLSSTTKDDVTKIVGEIVALRGQIRAERDTLNAALAKEGLSAFGGWYGGGWHGGGCPMMGGAGPEGFGGCPGMGGGHGMHGGYHDGGGRGYYDGGGRGGCPR